MRKILLGTTAVVSAAFGAAVITPAAAQDAPTVRIGGSIQAYYGYINQNGASSNPGGTADFGRTANATPNAATGLGGYTATEFLGTNTTLTGGAAGGLNGVAAPGGAGVSLGVPTATPTGALANTTTGTGIIGTVAAAPSQGSLTNRTITTPLSATGAGAFARSGKNDFLNLPAISVIVSGKAAQGFTYGGQVDLEFNALEGNLTGGNRSSVQRSTAVVGEAYVFVAHERFGQVRMGDEDGVLGGLMNSGFVTNFGTGGVYGVWEQFQIRQSGNRTQTGPGQLGDNTKVIYMSPQFYGFDFGASYAPNGGGFGNGGCPSDTATAGCDRAYAFRGATAWAVAPAGQLGAMARRNEYQLAARYRGSFAGVGVSATAGYVGAGTAYDLSNAGAQVRTMNNLNVWQVGAQATYMGFTLGAAYYQGDYNFFWGNTIRGDRQAQTLNVGASYTSGPFTFGSNMVTGVYEGGGRSDFDAASGRLVRQSNPTAYGDRNNLASQRRWGMSVGANYRLAPGLDLIAEYVYHSVRENGRDLDAARAGIQSRGFANVFIMGSRLAF